ncbi:hypothetical protein FRUB_05248 [Fimbriiglobus ruber]|uniref:Uncharacterized protein n=1 Tax=Fimbriiglobus ruber TaxID=1908690 RepID=A0A225DT27_9BACT|nr:hypothetical protein FRUB_05248 [Fimbriiglobus ruber]
MDDLRDVRGGPTREEVGSRNYAKRPPRRKRNRRKSPRDDRFDRPPSFWNLRDRPRE